MDQHYAILAYRGRGITVSFHTPAAFNTAERAYYLSNRRTDMNMAVRRKFSLSEAGLEAKIVSAT
jgi:hypothetical protein